jgi:hypothetical protein
VSQLSEASNPRLIRLKCSLEYTKLGREGLKGLKGLLGLLGFIYLLGLLGFL